MAGPAMLVIAVAIKLARAASTRHLSLKVAPVNGARTWWNPSSCLPTQQLRREIGKVGAAASSARLRSADMSSFGGSDDRQAFQCLHCGTHTHGKIAVSTYFTEKDEPARTTSGTSWFSAAPAATTHCWSLTTSARGTTTPTLMTTVRLCIQLHRSRWTARSRSRCGTASWRRGSA